jgi:hypothetical protein
MKRVLVRYRVKADRVAENEAFVRGVFEQLAHAAPPGLRYSSLKLEDGVSFVHIMDVEAGATLTGLPAFKAFSEQIRDRCDDQPIAMEFTSVGNYRLFAS